MTRASDFVFNAREAAVFLGAHVETVRRLARRGEIPSFKVGRDWRFHKEALLRWAEEQRSHDEPGSVLIVDDNAEVGRIMSLIVEKIGYRARYVTDASEGLKQVSRDAPDLILLDLVMPGMTGPEFLRELRVTFPDLPVVIVTAYPDSDLMKQATQYAPLMLLAKPVDADLLKRTVSMAVGEKLARGATP
jgi:excisionase family DNA binding protein